MMRRAALTLVLSLLSAAAFAQSTGVTTQVTAGLPVFMTQAALGASATYTQSIGVGIANSATGPYAYITVQAYSDQAGSFQVLGTVDGTNYSPLGQASYPVSAGGVGLAKVPLSLMNLKIVYTNGSTAQTKFLMSYILSAN